MALLQVMTESGMVEGLPSANQIISVFKGIPFAKAPVGDLRWKAPQPTDSWQGVRQCYKFGPIAMQERFSSEGGGNTLAAKEFYVVEYPMSEDCLYLNVWTPAKSADAGLPVAVYVHGGGYETGFSYLNAYDGDAFGLRDIIVVTISYRLNVFGFLATEELTAEEGSCAGNFGTMDQIFAVDWVRRNISAFGGDPDNLTIFGQSAGGMSIQHMAASPLMKGKYKRAIFQSGGGISRDGFMGDKTLEDAKANGARFLEILGVSSIEEARKCSQEEVIEAFFTMKGRRGYSDLFLPAIDGYVNPIPTDAFFRAGMHQDADYMIGCTADEMRNVNAPAPSPKDCEAFIRRTFPAHPQEALAAIPVNDVAVNQTYMQNPMGDQMKAADLAWCENELKLGRKPSYMYYFTYVPPGAENAHHSAEHHYVFQTLVRSYRPYTGFDYDLSIELCNYWCNFIKTGNPNGDGEEFWKPYTKEAPEALIIDKERRMGKVPTNAVVDYYIQYVLNE